LKVIGECHETKLLNQWKELTLGVERMCAVAATDEFAWFVVTTKELEQ
jgi:hypothetical protein